MTMQEPLGTSYLKGCAFCPLIFVHFRSIGCRVDRQLLVTRLIRLKWTIQPGRHGQIQLVG